MADNVSKGQHSMSANNRSQGLMTVVATADFSALFPFFACICVCSLTLEKLFCQQPPGKNTSATHAGRSVNRNKTKGAGVLHSHDGMMVCLSSATEVWPISFPAKRVLKWSIHNLTVADVDCVCVFYGDKLVVLLFCVVFAALFAPFLSVGSCVKLI